jgi:hypothetical protein
MPDQTTSTPSSSETPKTQEQLDRRAAAETGGDPNPDFVKVYKLEEIGSQRTFRVVYGDDYAAEADRISMSGRTVQPGSHVLILAPGAETRIFGDKGLPAPTSTMLASVDPFVRSDLQSQHYMDPRPSPEVDPARHPELSQKIQARQAQDEEMRTNRFKTREEFKGETPAERQTRLERETQEHDASLRESTQKSTAQGRTASTGTPDAQKQQKAAAMRKQLQGQSEIV